MRIIHKVTLFAYEFDCFPGHITLRSTAQGSSRRVAIERASRRLMNDPQLKRKQVREFTIKVNFWSESK